MTYSDKVKQIGKSNGGYITYGDALEVGIPSSILSRMAKEGKLNRIAAGIYILPGYLEDDFYTLSIRYKSAVFARKTALYLWNLSNERLSIIEANFPSHFNTSRLNNVLCHYPCKRLYDLGQCEVMTPFGHKIKAYDIERCLCDLFFYYDDFDAEGRAYVIKNVDKSKIDIDKLLFYAKELKVLREIKTALEIIL